MGEDIEEELLVETRQFAIGGDGEQLVGEAAAFVFKRRLHTISLFVFRSDGLSWPTSGLVPVGRVMARPARVKGFNVLFWRDGELGYALVSDVDAGDLAALGARIEPAG